MLAHGAAAPHLATHTRTRSPVFRRAAPSCTAARSRCMHANNMPAAQVGAVRSLPRAVLARAAAGASLTEADPATEALATLAADIEALRR